MLRNAYRDGSRRPMLQLSTGAGKTVIAAAIMQGARSKGLPAIFCVPAISLIDQTVKAFSDEGLGDDIGVIQADHPMTDASKPIQIASVQSLINRDIPLAGVVIIDEAHRWFQFYGDWMALPEWRQVPFIGLSATPWTKGLGQHFDRLLIPARMKQLILDNWLTPFRVFAPSEPNLEGVKVQAGDYVAAQLGERMAPLQADIVESWKKHWGLGKTLVFCVDRAHAAAVRDQFAGAGIPAGYCDMNTTLEERRELMCQFHEGHLSVVCNVGTLTTGIDWDVRCIVLARPTKSEMLYVQMIGRGLRTAEGKTDLLILDHSKTTRDLGFVDDIHHDTLDGGDWEKSSGNKKTLERLPKPCPQCAFLKLPGQRECPQCGFLPKRASELMCDDGELVELKSVATSDEKAVWWQQILGYAYARDKSDGWASHTFKARFGVWPNHYRHLPPIEPGPAVRSYIKSRAIAWAKSQGKEGGRYGRSYG